MSAELEFDEETSRLVEAVYLTPDVAATRHAVLRALELRQGERFLDVGEDPGCSRPRRRGRSAQPVRSAASI